MKPKALEDIFAEIIAVYENLRAEVIIAEIQEKSDITADDFVIANQSSFSRPYRRDIIDVDNLINKNMLTLNLSRNGLYDSLPEGLFHVQRGSNKTDSYMAHRQTLKQEEQDARLFFAPLENEFFYQRLRIESSERELLDNFYNLNDEFLIDFWNISRQNSEDHILKLIKLLPFSYQIAGDFELTRLCLENILNEKVYFKKKYDDELSHENKINSKVKENGFRLGINSILTSDFKEILSPVLEVTIGPISEKNINNYLKDDGIMKFINTFYDYFVPIEIDVTTKFTVEPENGFLLDQANSPIIGISTHI